MKFVSVKLIFVLFVLDFLLDVSKGVLYAECRVELSLSKTILFSTFISLPGDLQTQQGLKGVRGT